ncbi:MAG: thermonuclease family protein [candidate division WOR-3 bacterium]
MQKQVFLFFILFCIFCANTQKVTEIIDGDTFKTEDGKTVRLLGINAPEMSEPGGDIAKDFLALLILNKRVRMRRDVTERDDYNRLLRYVFLDDRFINAEMVRMGFAETRFYPPDTLYKKQLEELEKIAIRNKRGLWNFPVFQLPDTTGRYIKISQIEDDKKEIISWQDAEKYYGKIKTVEGRIVATNNTGKVCFLNFHKDWKRYFTAVIFASDFYKFPKNPEDYYLNRKVRVTGLIKEYQGKPEMVLKSPNQIIIVE